ncbi:MAG: hypothetical protein KAQ68_04540, partial [Clostridiales bacterium]|nr:hypothetical protein [Clostridiales bacterium]
MKTYKLLVLALVVLLMVSIFPTTAIATNSDFDVEYEFNPEIVPFKGGNVQMVLQVENKGTTNITWVDVVVNTAAPYSERWTGTIVPGAIRTISFWIPFAEDDLNIQKILQVSMNNNITANPDGVKMFTFELEGKINIFAHTFSVTPVKTSYEHTDTIEITHNFTNSITTHAATNARTQLFIRVNGDVEMVTSVLSHGMVFPGMEISRVMTFDLSEFSAGDFHITSNIKFDMMGESYSLSANSVEFTINEPEFDFTAVLSAEPTEIAAGETVEFTVALSNNGDSAIDTFEIRNAEGGLIAATESMPAGGSGSVPTSASIHENTDVSYVVIAKIGEHNDSMETNTVHIVVVEPTEEPTATPTETPEPIATETLSPSPSDEVLPSATTIEKTSEKPIEVVREDVENEAKSGLSTTMLLLIMGILALIIASLIVLTVIMLKRNKEKS